ncbi:MAG: hypothetical protein ACO1SV_18700 [Fimbriimonas sp.]
MDDLESPDEVVADPYTRLITEIAALRGQLIAYSELTERFDPAAAIDGIASLLALHVPEGQLKPLLIATEHMGRTMVNGGLQAPGNGEDPAAMIEAANAAMKLRVALEGPDMTKWSADPGG